MMEKYGTDLDMLPPTDEQYQSIRKLASERKEIVKVPSTRKEAEELIEKLSK